MNEISQKLKLPEGWKWVRLGEVVEESKERNTRSLVKTVLTISNQYGFVDQSDFFGRLLSSKDTQKYKVVSTNYFAYNPARINVGSIALNEIPESGILSPMYVVFKIKYSLMPKFFKFYTLTDRFKNQVLNGLAGSVRECLSFSSLITFAFPLPPLPEQQKIAEILETVDNAREKTDQIIEKYKRIKQGLMQELLTKGIDENGKIRTEKTHRFKDSPLGRIPEEWEVKRLGEVISQIETGTWGDEIHTNYNNVFPIIRSTEIDEEGRFDLSTVAYRSLPYKKAIKYILNIGDILLVASSGSPDLIGRAAIIKSIPKDIKLLFSNFMLCIRSKNNIIISKFLFYILRSSLYCSFLSSFRETTTGLINFPKSEFENFEIPLPPLPEQQKIAEILSQIDEVIEKETQYRDKLKRLKAGLMEDLLTGKVEVNHLIKEEA